MTQNSFNSQEIESIYYKFQQIDKKLQDLEKANQRIIVTGGKSHSQPKPINITKEELINIYNYTPQILEEYATPVSITGDTYRQKTLGNIYLEYTINGYYWVILREKDSEKFYHLVPNGNRNLNFYRLQNQLELLFIIHGQKKISNHNFILEKLGYLEILPSGNLWQLANRGMIKIVKASPVNRLLSDLEKLNEKLEQIPQTTNNVLAIINENHYDFNIIQEKQKDLEKYLIETIEKLLEVKSNLEHNIDKLEIKINNNIEQKEITIYQNLQQLSSTIDALNDLTKNQFKITFDSLKTQEDTLKQIDHVFSYKLSEQKKRIDYIKGNLGCLNFIICIFILLIIVSLFIHF